MKRHILIVVCAILFSILSLTAISHVSAQTRESASPSLTPSLDATGTPTKIEYELPYPGVLPGNPLYYLKAFRDKLVSLLISDPLKKAEYDLLNSDKRLAMGAALVRAGKHELAVETISKGNNYFEEALSSLQKARASSEDTSALLGRMALAVKKHEEVVVDLETKLAGREREKLVYERKRLAKYDATLQKLLEK